MNADQQAEVTRFLRSYDEKLAQFKSIVLTTDPQLVARIIQCLNDESAKVEPGASPGDPPSWSQARAVMALLGIGTVLSSIVDEMRMEAEVDG